MLDNLLQLNKVK